MIVNRRTSGLSSWTSRISRSFTVAADRETVGVARTDRIEFLKNMNRNVLSQAARAAIQFKQSVGSLSGAHRDCDDQCWRADSRGEKLGERGRGYLHHSSRRHGESGQVSGNGLQYDVRRKLEPKFYPGQHLEFLGSYGLWFYYLQTGDLESIREIYEPTKTFLFDTYQFGNPRISSNPKYHWSIYELDVSVRK